MSRFDLSVYAIADPTLLGGRALVPSVLAAVAGGATLIQLRDKISETRALVDAARALRAALRGSGVKLLINDRVDVAQAAGADGVHLGQTDMCVADARRLLGPRAIIGVTIRTDEEARDTSLGPADYAGVGGIFATSSKRNTARPLGPSGFRRVAGILRGRAPGFALCGIAGIDANNAAAVVAAGADGVAVISAIFMAEDISAATRRLASAVAQGFASR